MRQPRGDRRLSAREQAAEIGVAAALFGVQVLGFLTSALGCGDDGPLDYGTATDLQEAYCEAVPDAEWLLSLVVLPPLVFLLAHVVTGLTRRKVPLLAALPFALATGVPPILIFVGPY